MWCYQKLKWNSFIDVFFSIVRRSFIFGGLLKRGLIFSFIDKQRAKVARKTENHSSWKSQIIWELSRLKNAWEEYLKVQSARGSSLFGSFDDFHFQRLRLFVLRCRSISCFRNIKMCIYNCARNKRIREWKYRELSSFSAHTIEQA